MNYPRNLTAFRFAPGSIDLRSLGERLAAHPLTHPGPLDLSRSGFVPIGPDDAPEAAFTLDVDRFHFFIAGTRTKILPASTVNERVGEKVQALKADGVTVGRKQRKRVKAEIINDMLAAAFDRLATTPAWIDERGWLFVDTATAARAERCLSLLRDACGSFPVVALTTGVSPQTRFDSWASERGPQAPFALGEDCVMSSSAVGSKWTGKGVDLAGMEVEEHLNAGLHFDRLGLVYRDRLSFTLDTSMVVRSLRRGDLDSALDGADEGGDSGTEQAAVLTIAANRIWGRR